MNRTRVTNWLIPIGIVSVWFAAMLLPSAL
jgi:hypothetical protein